MPLRISNQGQTKLYNANGEGFAATKTHLSTNINILVNGVAVAAVQDINWEERRDVRQIDEIGTDGHIDSAPSKSTEISGSCSRVRFDGQRITEAFMRGFIHVSAQRIPFDITIIDKFAASNNDDSSSFITTTVHNVWITGVSTKYSAGDFVIIDSMNWVAESISSVKNNGPVVGAVNNGGVTMSGEFELNSFEQEADTGLYRGSLDAPGLLKAFDGSGGRSF
jgi:hypothetical protein